MSLEIRLKLMRQWQCDIKRPSCSTCAKRGFDCVYDTMSETESRSSAMRRRNEALEQEIVHLRSLLDSLLSLMGSSQRLQTQVADTEHRIDLEKLVQDAVTTRDAYESVAYHRANEASRILIKGDIKEDIASTVHMSSWKATDTEEAYQGDVNLVPRFQGDLVPSGASAEGTPAEAVNDTTPSWRPTYTTRSSSYTYVEDLLAGMPYYDD